MGIWQKVVVFVIFVLLSFQFRVQFLVMYFFLLVGWVIDGFGLLTDLCYSIGWVKFGGFLGFVFELIFIS